MLFISDVLIHEFVLCYPIVCNHAPQHALLSTVRSELVVPSTDKEAMVAMPTSVVYPFLGQIVHVHTECSFIIRIKLSLTF